ncbi:MAG: DNA polymerase IV [Ruminococcus sp.]|uniref:DNA polymerase Y family protein n=1 Tax=Ruminococcus sp. TaxID=41978 RepID=UPI002872B80F|nr:DNA polymerase IV [Ruminococcus sp.]MBQ3285840.1 DNA polymerase IV [Ruminococcus sp.]
MDRLIFHIDVNSAFLSWEATKRVKQGLPDLRLIPSCIGGRPESRRGVVLAKSIPAKQYNIKTGEPISMALRKCPSLLIAPPNFKLYSQCSKAFKDICRSYAPVVEEFSIDECFLDFSHTEHIYPDPIALAYEIKNKIHDELGFTVNVGIGENKLCAKMASDFEKPDKVHTLFMNEIPDKMWPLPVRDLLFVGGSTAKKLNDAGIRTIGELAKTDSILLKSLIGDKMSIQAHNYANGIDNSPVRAEPEEAKGYSNSITLEDDVRDFEAANAILLALADSVTRHMRRDGSKAFNVGVTIRYLDFKTRSHQKQLNTPVETTNAVYDIAKKLLAELWKDRRPLRLMGISLTNLTRDNNAGVQLSLFGEEQRIDNERDEKLDKTIDSLRGRFGSEAIKRGTVMKNSLNVARKFKGEEDSSK